MDRAGLERLLDEGVSLEEIGRRVGRDASTVGYWVRKHGLEAVHRKRQAPRGGIPRETLQRLVGAGLTLRAIAAELDLSQSTVGSLASQVQASYAEGGPPRLGCRGPALD